MQLHPVIEEIQYVKKILFTLEPSTRHYDIPESVNHQGQVLPVKSEGLFAHVAHSMNTLPLTIMQ